MIAVPAGVRVLVATKPVDFRRGADSLAVPTLALWVYAAGSSISLTIDGWSFSRLINPRRYWARRRSRAVRAPGDKKLASFCKSNLDLRPFT